MRGHGTRATAVLVGASSKGAATTTVSGTPLSQQELVGRTFLALGYVYGVAPKDGSVIGIGAPTGAERCRTTGVGDPNPSQRQTVARQHVVDCPAQEADIGLGKAERGGRPAEPREVAGQRERDPVNHLDRLEDTVPHGEAMVSNGDGRSLRVFEQLTVHPCVHASEISPGGRVPGGVRRAKDAPSLCQPPVRLWFPSHRRRTGSRRRT